MFTFSLINHPENFSVDRGRIEQILAQISVEVPIPQQGILNIAWLSDEEIQTLNLKYRDKDATTDVLSFHYSSDFSELDQDDIAGECIFSEPLILEQAEQHGHTPRDEWEILFIHSVLHILGYDHETDDEYEKMWEREGILRKIFHLSPL